MMPSSFTPGMAPSFDADLDPWRAELVHEEIGDRLRVSLEQVVRMIGGEGL